MSGENRTTSCPKGAKSCPIFADIQVLQGELEELRQQVSRDFLTGLYNVRHLQLTLENEFERTDRSRQPTSLIMLDIDFFKEVNDQYGHIAGDKVLQNIAAIMMKSVRKIDVCCRYGGEEFAIILPSTHQLVGIQVAERIRKSIQSTRFRLTDQEIGITASCGVGSHHYSMPESAKEFIERVDKLLYKAKNQGRNLVMHAPTEQFEPAQVSDEEKDILFNNEEPTDK